MFFYEKIDSISVQYDFQVAKSLDREKKESYELRIVSTDGGEPKLESIKPLKIKILDVNDNPPTFVRKDYEATIQEDAEKGSVKNIENTFFMLF